MAKAATENSEIIIGGIARDDVRTGDTWDSIAGRWGVNAGDGLTAAQRLERANSDRPNVLTAGSRVVIPPVDVHL